MPATPSTVRPVRDAAMRVARAVAATEEELQRIRLAVSEAVTNAVRHAYPPARRSEGRVEVLIGALEDRTVVVVVADEGRGLGAPSADPGLGMGMKVMAQSADDLVLARRSTGGTEVRMSFRPHART